MSPTRMQFKRSWTVAETVRALEQQALLLPGIQRSFVWKRQQISSLFNSLMCGYPIGSVLVWRTRKSEHPNLRFRRFVRDWSGTGNSRNANVPREAWINAVLDGQQRLTALYIGLAGTYATSPTVRRGRLHLDLETDREDEGPDTDRYRFEFRPDGGNEDVPWFPVAEATGLRTDKAALDRALQAHQIDTTPARRRTLKRLVQVINEDELLRFDVEANATLDRVLNIFTRTNTGGTKLSYVDLLISVLTARWQAEDARQHFDDLRGAVNGASPEGFQFSIDRLVKAALVLLDATDTRFHIDNFTKGTMSKKLEDQWDDYSNAMVIAAETLGGFGLSARTLAAENVVIPVAYYAKHRGLTKWYPSAHSHERDRLLVRGFVARTLLQRRYWTGAVDQVLSTSREVIKKHGDSRFPLDELEHALESVKPISVTDEFIDELCDLSFSDRRTLVLLRLLFPGLQPKKGFDKDHIFPTSCFSYQQLRKDGVPTAKHDEIKAQADRFPNLQLLDRVDNRGGGKSSKMPKLWLNSLTSTARSRYSVQFVTYVPGDLSSAEAFWDRRREQLRSQIKTLLCA